MTTSAALQVNTSAATPLSVVFAPWGRNPNGTLTFRAPVTSGYSASLSQAVTYNVDLSNSKATRTKSSLLIRLPIANPPTIVGGVPTDSGQAVFMKIEIVIPDVAPDSMVRDILGYAGQLLQQGGVIRSAILARDQIL